MNMKLKKPSILSTEAVNNEGKQGQTSRFINDGDKRPNNGKLIPSTFRLPKAVIELLEDDSHRTGQNKTMILKAAIIAYSQLDENSKNHWLLESLKM
ncbi:stability/ partitioning determinant [Photorhabdus asymbiotica]|uniref:stability/ partitioning determinant n=1 Tax=Photorhabdus asymbiotica TaxID=291112 RepID=UPI003DA6CFA4